RMTWIGKDAAVSERTRTKFHSPAVPRDDPSARNPIGSLGRCHLRVRKVFYIDVMCVFSERSGNLIVRRSWTEEGHRQTSIAYAVVGNGPLQSRAKGSAIVAGSRLNIDLVKEASAHQFSIGCAIERNPAGQCQPSHAGLPLKMAADVKHRHFKPFLKRSGKITVVVGDFFTTLPPRSELLFEETPSRRVVVALLSRAVQSQCRNTDGSIVAELDCSFEKCSVPRGIAIRRESHDLVFIAIEIE